MVNKFLNLYLRNDRVKVDTILNQSWICFVIGLKFYLTISWLYFCAFVPLKHINNLYPELKMGCVCAVS